MEDKKKINYSLPDGYFLQMEDKVRDRIRKSEEKGSWLGAKPGFGVVKPALLLVCMFLVIFGIGYGTMALTGTLGYEKPSEMVAETEADVSQESDQEIEETIEYLSETMSTAAIETFIAENL